MPTNSFELARAGLLSLIATKIPDNDQEQITPLAVRTVLQSIVHSALVKLSDVLAGPNLRPDLRKAVRWYDEDTEHYDGDGPQLSDLDPKLMCLHTTISVEFGPDGTNKEYALVYDAEGPYEVYRDATFTGALIKARLTLLGSPEQVNAGIPEFNPYGPGPTADDVYRGPDENGHNGAQVTYQDKIWTTKQPVARSMFDNHLIPYPGTPAGAAWFKELSPTPLTHLQNTDTGTTAAEYVIGLNSQTQGTTEYRLIGFLADSQRANVALGARWTYQEDGSDVVELVQCLGYAAPAGNPANVWTTVGSGGGGIEAFYLEDETLAYIDAGGQQYAIDLGEALAPARSTRRLFVVEGNGQTGTGFAGTFARPFNTLSQGYTAAVAGSAVVVLRGGAGTDSFGRPMYTDGVSVARDVNWQGVGFPVLGQYFELGAYAGSARRIRVSGLEFLLRSVVLKPAAGAHQIEFDSCRWQGQAFFQLFGQGVSNASIDQVLVRRSTFHTLQLDGGYGCVLFSQRDDIGLQAQTLILEDCELSSENTPLFTGTIHPDSRVILRGHTRLNVPDGYPLSSMTRHTGGLVAEADWLIDERASVGTDSTELAGQFQGTDPQQADFYIYADAVGTYQVHSATGVTGVSYQRNGSAATLPVSVEEGNTLSILATGAGTVRLRKQS